MRRLVVLGLAACGAPIAKPRPQPQPMPVAAAVAPAAKPVSVPYTPPAFVPPRPFRLECRDFARDTRSPAGTVYEFAAIGLYPVRGGPQMRDAPRIGPARTVRTLRAAFSAHGAEITDCWKAASSRGARATRLDVGMTIDPLGSLHDLTITSQRPEDGALIACVHRDLDKVAFVGTTPRSIHLVATLAFTRADQPAWKRVRPFPLAHHVEDDRRGHVCAAVVDDPASVEVRFPTPIEVSDRDPSRDPPRRGPLIEVKIGCVDGTSPDNDKRGLRTMLASNFGALQGCYADALDRDPQLVGDVELQLAFHEAATTPVAVVSGAGDAQFHRCLLDAARDLWLPREPSHWSRTITATFTLALNRSSPAAASADPVALLDAGDAEGALAASVARVNAATSAVDACRGRAGVLAALAALAPWLDDPRVRAAIRDLAESATKLGPAAALACVAPVVPAIEGLGRANHSWSGPQQLTYVWLDRYEAVMPLAPYLEDRDRLRRDYAEALLLTPRAEQGREILRELAAGPKPDASAAARLTALATTMPSILDGCNE